MSLDIAKCPQVRNWYNAIVFKEWTSSICIDRSDLQDKMLSKKWKVYTKKMKGTKQFVDYADNLVIKRLGFGVKLPGMESQLIQSTMWH